MTLVAVCPRCCTPLVESMMDDPSALMCPHCEAESDPFVYGHFDATRAVPRRGRQPSIIRLLAGIVGGGLLGIFIGAYALLWLRGPTGDLLGIAHWLPEAALPPSMQGVADGN